MTITVPEHAIIAGIRGGLKYLQEDLNYCLDNNVEEKSLLYGMMGTVGMSRRYDYFSQIKSIILREEDHERNLYIDMIYNAKSDKLPSMYLSLPDEQRKNNVMSFDEDVLEHENGDGTFSKIVARKWRCVYNIVIIDDNLEEIVLIYNLLKLILLGLSNHFSVLGFDNIAIAGGDIRLKDTLAPQNMATRGITMSFDYSSQGVLFDRVFYPKDFLFQGTPKI